MVKLRTLALGTAIGFVSGFGLGKCNMNELQEGANQAYTTTERAYNRAKPVMRTAYEKTEQAYNATKPVVKDIINHFQEKTDTKKKEEEKKQDKEAITAAIIPKK